MGPVPVINPFGTCRGDKMAVQLPRCPQQILDNICHNLLFCSLDRVLVSRVARNGSARGIGLMRQVVVSSDSST